MSVSFHAGGRACPLIKIGYSRRLPTLKPKILLDFLLKVFLRATLKFLKLVTVIIVTNVHDKCNYRIL